MDEIKLIKVERCESDVQEQIRRNKALLKKIRMEREKREMYMKIIFAMVIAAAITCSFACGMITGRLLAYLYAVGC